MCKGLRQKSQIIYIAEWRNFMENKILFFDIDGTILDNDKNIPDGVEKVTPKS